MQFRAAEIKDLEAHAVEAQEVGNRVACEPMINNNNSNNNNEQIMTLQQKHSNTNIQADKINISAPVKIIILGKGQGET